MCTSRVYLLPPVLEYCPFHTPGGRKMAWVPSIFGFLLLMAHGMLPLPQNTISALNRISWKPWSRAQARARPKCHGPHGIFSSPGSELILFRAEMVFWGSGIMPWAPSIVKIRILMVPMPVFWCHGILRLRVSNPGDNGYTRDVHIPTPWMPSQTVLRCR